MVDLLEVPPTPAFTGTHPNKTVRWTWRLKTEVIAAYGGVCKCCGEETVEFLQIDHSLNDGAAHRKLVGKNSGAAYWTWLRQNGFPRDLGIRILCANCNMAVRYGRVCPHQTKAQHA